MVMMIGGCIMSGKKVVYADHAATTAVTESVMAAMEPYFREYWGNLQAFICSEERRQQPSETPVNLSPTLSAAMSQRFISPPAVPKQ